LLSGELLEISAITLSDKERHFIVPLPGSSEARQLYCSCFSLQGLRRDVKYGRMLGLYAAIRRVVWCA